jgi:hypothetical protein
MEKGGRTAKLMLRDPRRIVGRRKKVVGKMPGQQRRLEFGRDVDRYLRGAMDLVNRMRLDNGNRQPANVVVVVAVFERGARRE